ncbi:MAG: tetratricopeptide repeat protein [Acidobacteriota bacterium]|nr:tetratricopeptide repeat protein [Acidobacteriota bacterium]
MDRRTRKDLKTDKFAEDVFDVFEWASVHKAEVVRYGAILLAVVLIVVGIVYYNRNQAVAREEALAKALRIDDATIGDVVQPTNMHFDAEADKDKAKMQAFTNLSAKYNGSQEAAVADMYLGSYAVDAGNLAEAEKRYRKVVDDGPKAYAGLARLSLAQVYSSEGKMADAEKVLRDAIANPSLTVSKEHATIVLAELLAPNNPAEAHTLIDPLRTSLRGAISRTAITDSANLPPVNAAAPAK